MDITYYEHTLTRDGKSSVVRTMTDEPPKWGFYDLDQTDKVTLHLEVGTPVIVRAFGRNRPGRVTKLGRIKVQVRFIRNAQDERDERGFGAWDISPANNGQGDVTPHERVTIR